VVRARGAGWRVEARATLKPLPGRPERHTPHVPPRPLRLGQAYVCSLLIPSFVIAGALTPKLITDFRRTPFNLPNRNSDPWFSFAHGVHRVTPVRSRSEEYATPLGPSEHATYCAVKLRLFCGP